MIILAVRRIGVAGSWIVGASVVNSSVVSSVQYILHRTF